MKCTCLPFTPNRPQVPGRTVIVSQFGNRITSVAVRTKAHLCLASTDYSQTSFLAFILEPGTVVRKYRRYKSMTVYYLLTPSETARLLPLHTKSHRLGLFAVGSDICTPLRTPRHSRIRPHTFESTLRELPQLRGFRAAWTSHSLGFTPSISVELQIFFTSRSRPYYLANRCPSSVQLVAIIPNEQTIPCALLRIKLAELYRLYQLASSCVQSRYKCRNNLGRI